LTQKYISSSSVLDGTMSVSEPLTSWTSPTVDTEVYQF
jgi:hypothetical protein